MKSRLDLLKEHHTYDHYLKTLRLAPSYAVYAQYKREMAILADSKPEPIVTQSEKTYIQARKIWSDVVSVTDPINHKRFMLGDVKVNVIRRIKSLKLKSPEKVYEQCLAYLRHHTVITVSFNLKCLPKNLTSYQLLNLWEIHGSKNCHGNTRFTPYGENRNAREKEHFNYLPYQIKSNFISNLHARPHYGALHLLDKNKNVSPTESYGKSFIILKDIVKQGALFLPGDSLCVPASVRLTTNNYLELLLAQFSDYRLSVLINCINGQSFPKNFQNSYYIEAMLPPINWLDPTCIEHIHLDSTERQSFASKDDLKSMAKLGISVSYDSKNPYQVLTQSFIKAIDKSNYLKLYTMLIKHPSLIKVIDNKGRSVVERMYDNQNNPKLLYTFFSCLNGEVKLNFLNLISMTRSQKLKNFFKLKQEEDVRLSTFLRLSYQFNLSQSIDEKNTLSMNAVFMYINHCNNPQEIVRFINQLFDMEKQYPYLTKTKSHLSWGGATWGDEKVSYRWFKIIKYAKKAILQFAETEPKNIKWDDVEIQEFLKKSTKRWANFFEKESELSEYIKLRDNYYLEQNALTNKS